jgi:hypothetical protein
MNEREYVVAIVFDPLFGDWLRELSEQYDLWTVPSPQNRRVVEELWASTKAGHPAKQVTMWSSPGAPESQNEWLRVLEEVELHHGEYSHDPPVSTLEVHGAELTPHARAALSEYEYERLEPLPGGFRAVRRVA